jgi:hypothetical protein
VQSHKRIDFNRNGQALCPRTNETVLGRRRIVVLVAKVHGTSQMTAQKNEQQPGRSPSPRKPSHNELRKTQGPPSAHIGYNRSTDKVD